MTLVCLIELQYLLFDLFYPGGLIPVAVSTGYKLPTGPLEAHGVDLVKKGQMFQQRCNVSDEA
jgi:hypothetical protein